MLLKLSRDDVPEGHLARADLNPHYLVLPGNACRCASYILFLYVRNKLFALSYC